MVLLVGKASPPLPPRLPKFSPHPQAWLSRGLERDHQGTEGAGTGVGLGVLEGLDPPWLHGARGQTHNCELSLKWQWHAPELTPAKCVLTPGPSTLGHVTRTCSSHPSRDLITRFLLSEKWSRIICSHTELINHLSSPTNIPWRNIYLRPSLAHALTSLSPL